MSLRLRTPSTALAVFTIATLALSANAAVPTVERAVLDTLYSSTSGVAWTNNIGWGGAVGTECAWYGITCDGAGGHVTKINLSYNNLAGALPALQGLTALEYFDVDSNQLAGSIPNLSSLTTLRHFDAGANKLTDAIPDLSGLLALQYFNVSTNQLTGSIPNLSNLATLQVFWVYNNQLTGPIPSLSGLSVLQTFWASDNRLDGSIPDLSGLPAMQNFDVGFNQLTGSIPDLSNLAVLESFQVEFNQLTGSIPELSRLSLLQRFDGSKNRLSGSIPALSGLSALQVFWVTGNQLTGSIPDLSSLSALYSLDVSGNQLTGTPPAAPVSLGAGGSFLCPNFLHTPSPTDTAWNTATGQTPWSQNCVPGYLVTTSAGMNGNIEPSHAVPKNHQDFVFIAPNASYKIDTVGGTCGGALTDNVYTTNPIVADCSVTVSFKIIVADVATPAPGLSPWASVLLSVLFAVFGTHQRNLGPKSGSECTFGPCVNPPPQPPTHPSPPAHLSSSASHRACAASSPGSARARRV